MAFLYFTKAAFYFFAWILYTILLLYIPKLKYNVNFVNTNINPFEVKHSIFVDIPGCQQTELHLSVNSITPIFVITRDRLLTLKKAVESYKKLSTPWKLILCDHNSTYGPMIEYLKKMEQSGVEVWYIRVKSWSDALVAIKANISKYLELHPEYKYYVVTDPDISIENTKSDILSFYASVLEACPSINVIGPSLKISDIPNYYDKKETVIKRQRHNWNTIPGTAIWNGIGYNLQYHPIDTTFAIRRRSTLFNRLSRKSVRTYAPYMAIHIDWYYNSSNPTEDYLWYKNRELDVNHWR